MRNSILFFFFKTSNFVIFLFLFGSNVQAQDVNNVLRDIESLPSYEEKVKVCVEKSNSFFITYNYISSIKVARLGIQIAESEKDEKRLITFKTLTGRCFLSMHEEDKGLNYFDQAEAMAKSIKDYGLLVDLHFEMVQVYRKTGNYAALSEELKLVRELIQKHSLFSKKEKADNLWGIYFSKTADYEKGEKLFRKIIKNTTNVTLRTEAMNNLGSSMNLRGEADSALTLFHRVYELTKEIGPKTMNLLVATNLAHVYKIKGNISKSIEFGNEAIALSKQLNSNFFETYGLQKLGTVYAKNGDYNKACSQLFNSYSKNIRTMDVTTNFLIDELKSEKIAARKAQKLLNNKKIEKRKKRNNRIVFISIVSSLSLIVLLVLIGFIYLQSKKRKVQSLKNEETRNKLLSNQKELKYRGSQISQAFDETKEISTMINTMSEEFPNSEYIKKVADKMDNLNDQLIIQNEWQRFLLKFNETYPQFEKRLMKAHSGLSFNDKKVCIYVKAELSPEQIASIKDISIVGVKASFKRLEEKLFISKHLNLQQYLSEL